MKPTQEQVIAWYEQANGWSPEGWDKTVQELERFAAVVAAAEREACAKVAEERWLDKANCTAEEMYELQKKSIADAIRARGQK